MNTQSKTNEYRVVSNEEACIIAGEGRLRTAVFLEGVEIKGIDHPSLGPVEVVIPAFGEALLIIPAAVQSA